MFRELKKKSLKKLWIWIIPFAVMGIGVLFYLRGDLLDLIKGPVGFSGLKSHEIDNQYVSIDIRFTLGCFAEKIIQDETTNIEKTTEAYYVIMTEDIENPKLLGFKVDMKDRHIMERMIANLVNGISDGTVLKETGKIVPMSEEEQMYMRQYLVDYNGYSNDSYDKNTIPYMIMAGRTAHGLKSSVLLISGIGGFCLLIGLFMLVRALSGGYQSGIKKELLKSGELNLEKCENDYNQGESFAKDFKVGKLCTFFFIRSKSKVLINKDILWAYTNRTKHYRNGVTTGIIISIILNTKQGKTFTINVSDETVAEDILDYYDTVTPSILVGYTEEYNNLYKRNMEVMMELSAQKANSVNLSTVNKESAVGEEDFSDYFNN